MIPQEDRSFVACFGMAMIFLMFALAQFSSCVQHSDSVGASIVECQTQLKMRQNQAAE